MDAQRNIDKQIAERRADAAFQARLAQMLGEERNVLDRLAADEPRPRFRPA